MAHERALARGEVVPELLENLAQPHIDSFDYFLGEGLEQVIEHLDGIEVRDFPRITSIHRCIDPIRYQSTT